MNKTATKADTRIGTGMTDREAASTAAAYHIRMAKEHEARGDKNAARMHRMYATAAQLR